MGARIILTKGDRYNALRYIKDVPTDNGLRVALWQCDCGEQKFIALRSVRSGLTQSCGCLYATGRSLHGYASAKHPDHRLYICWTSMHFRCYNPKSPAYTNYGGRGIRVAKIWHDLVGLELFVTWAKDNGYTGSLELDRKDNDGHYTPRNCRWVTSKTNNTNRRNTLYVADSISGKRLPLIELYDAIAPDVPYTTVFSRHKRGMALDRLFCGVGRG